MWENKVKESSLPSGYSFKLRWGEIDRFAKNRNLYQDLAMLEPRSFVDKKMMQESSKSLLFKITRLANVSLEMRREELLAFTNCYQQHIAQIETTISPNGDPEKEDDFKEQALREETFGEENCDFQADLKKRLGSYEMWLLRKMMRIPWTDKVSNEEVLARAGVNRRLIKDIRMRQLRFLGHVLWKVIFENLALTGKIEEKRSRGRQRILWMNSLAGRIQTKWYNNQEDRSNIHD
eukprot:gene16041-biopygen5402